MVARPSWPCHGQDARATRAPAMLESLPMHERLTNPIAQPPIDVRALESSVADCMLRDQRLIRGKIQRINQLLKTNRPASKLIDNVTQQINDSRQRKQQRLANLPRPTYPEGLPVVEKRD